MTFRKKIKITFFVLAIGLLLALYFANRQAKTYGYTGVTDVVTTVLTNKKLANAVEPKQLNIKISKADFEFIKDKREIAIDRGIQINVGDNYVPCKIDFANDKSTGEIRLKGHMTDHLQGNKWSYRVKSDEPVQGMYRFSIQHPGTRNYVYEWIYHQLLKNEGIIYLNYDFIEVIINDENLGIYALEEHFGQHVLERNNRPKGAILRWNPELYWDWRIDELQGAYINEEYSAFSSSFVEPYDRGTVKRDSELLENYQKGAYLLEMFRRGKLKTSDVFDMEKMARFHVIIDLVGGYHSLDWSDVKFYYNSETDRIEPVGYESFSVRKTEKIAGQRIPKSYDGIIYNYHDQLFSDPLFFEIYIRNLERIVSEGYLHKFMTKIQPELDEKMGLIAKEWPYRKVSFDGYFENVKLIRNNVDIPKPFHAFINPTENNLLSIAIAPVSDYPIQIIGVKRKDKIKYLPEVLNVPAKVRESYTKYFSISIENPFSKSTNLFLVAKVPGSSKTYLVEVNEYPAYKKNFELADSNFSTVDDSAIIAKSGEQWVFKNKITTLSQHITIPKGVTLYMYPNQSLKITDKGRITVEGSLSFQAYNSAEPISISTSKDGVILLNNGRFSASNVHCNGNNLFVADSSELIFKNCMFYDMAKLFQNVNNSQVTFYKCLSGSLNSLGVLNESIISIDQSAFRKGHLLAESNGSYWFIKDSEFTNFRKGIALAFGSLSKAYNSSFQRFDTLSSLSEGSRFQTFSSFISNIEQGFMIDSTKGLQTFKDVDLYKTKTVNIKKLISFV
ncbi:MAG: hypothetical protein R3279_04365 [Putridiphycobacter sp.]|nr:hypothetical protein [Putridiphycobacter sp.]